MLTRSALIDSDKALTRDLYGHFFHIIARVDGNKKYLLHFFMLTELIHSMVTLGM